MENRLAGAIPGESYDQRMCNAPGDRRDRPRFRPENMASEQLESNLEELARQRVTPHTQSLNGPRGTGCSRCAPPCLVFARGFGSWLSGSRETRHSDSPDSRMNCQSWARLAQAPTPLPLVPLKRDRETGKYVDFLELSTKQITTACDSRCDAQNQLSEGRRASTLRLER